MICGRYGPWIRVCGLSCVVGASVSCTMGSIYPDAEWNVRVRR